MAKNVPQMPVPLVDPVESEINQLFQKLHFCLEQRRLELIASYQEKIARPANRAGKLQELSKVKEVNERGFRLNENSELQKRILTEIEVELEKATETLPETRIVFECDHLPLEKLIAALGEVLEEEVPLIPNYLTMRPIVAVGKEGRDQGELNCPNAVTIDSNNCIFVVEGNAYGSYARISMFSEGGDFENSFTPQDMKEPHGIAIHEDYLYVTDAKLHAIFRFKIPQFTLVTMQGNRGSQIGEFNCPYNLTFYANGEMYVADCFNNRVQILNSS